MRQEWNGKREESGYFGARQCMTHCKVVSPVCDMHFLRRFPNLQHLDRGTRYTSASGTGGACDDDVEFTHKAGELQVPRGGIESHMGSTVVCRRLEVFQVYMYLNFLN